MESPSNCGPDGSGYLRSQPELCPIVCGICPGESIYHCVEAVPVSHYIIMYEVCPGESPYHYVYVPVSQYISRYEICPW